MISARNRMARYGIILTGVLFLVAPAGFAQIGGVPGVGSMLRKLTFSAGCGSGVGIGITFDGTNLWYSCYNSKLSTNPNDLYKADPVTGAVIASYSVAGGMGAIAYDAKRNVIWAGEGGGVASNVAAVIRIPLDANKNVSGPYQIAFYVPQAYNSPLTGQDIVDGLAIDTLNDNLYIHYDFATEIALYNATSGAFLGFIPEDAGIKSGKPVMQNPPVPNCVVSGLAIGGQVLFEGADYCDQVYGVDKTTLTDLFNFGIESSVGTSFDEKALTCDATSFPLLDAVWVKGAYSPQQAYAFEIPAATCGNGGQAPPPLQ